MILAHVPHPRVGDLGTTITVLRAVQEMVDHEAQYRARAHKPHEARALRDVAEAIADHLTSTHPLRWE